ncbi:MAG: DUF4160 domain-containing protein [Chitinivibrionales bacterium]|nr:DUF4160 domain-containing protein [Chitinivibrionales bacterium]MBD3358795.1 DUF4160 domain-containing protein [Chitinivibrionales bacterium]
MSPTVFFEGNNRFYFFSREERRMHVHVTNPEGEAKFWIEPTISLASSYNLSAVVLRRLQKLVEEHRDEIEQNWKKHFSS